MKSLGRSLVVVSALALAACDRGEQGAPPGSTPASSGGQPVVLSQLPNIDQNRVLDHIKALSSDEYEGRLPGTKGEELTVKYISDQYKAVGLEPGNPDGP